MAKKYKKRVIKADGSFQPFKESKILNSLKMAGTSDDVAYDTAERIKASTSEEVKTETIYKDAIDNLNKLEPKSALKYSLKRAVMDMGPDGYTFEKYVARIFNSQGYDTEHSRLVKGECVNHELDVIAQKGDEVNIIECKYHNDLGTKSGIKTALYIHSRYLDIKKEFCSDDKYNMLVWLATNTKVTSDVKKYAGCVGMKILAWKYPKIKNLEYYIETKNLYPVSIITRLSDRQKDKLYDSDVVTIKDIDFLGPDNFMRLLEIDKQKTDEVFAQIRLILY